MDTRDRQMRALNPAKALGTDAEGLRKWDSGGLFRLTKGLKTPDESRSAVEAIRL